MAESTIWWLLAGALVAAAVILGEVEIAGVGDSKQMSAKQRDKVFDLIRRDALGCSGCL